MRRGDLGEPAQEGKARHHRQGRHVNAAGLGGEWSFLSGEVCLGAVVLSLPPRRRQGHRHLVCRPGTCPAGLGQSAADFAKCAENLAHGFGAPLCRVRTARSGAVLLEFIRQDALAALVSALPMPATPDLKALPVGKREDGLPWLVKLHGTHVLIAGATGAGKASLLWGLVRAMFPLLQDGLARVLAADPKLMELPYGRVIFDTYGYYAADPAAIAAMLDQAVADMQDRARRFAGRHRDHAPTRDDPFTVVLVDEVAFLTAYQPDRKLPLSITPAAAQIPRRCLIPVRLCRAHRPRRGNARRRGGRRPGSHRPHRRGPAAVVAQDAAADQRLGSRLRPPDRTGHRHRRPSTATCTGLLSRCARYRRGTPAQLTRAPARGSRTGTHAGQGYQAGWPTPRRARTASRATPDQNRRICTRRGRNASQNRAARNRQAVRFSWSRANSHCL